MKNELILFIAFLLGTTLYGQDIGKIKPNLLGIVVKNVDKASEWYSDNLGFRIFKQMNFPEYDSLKIYFLEKDDFRLELIQNKKAVMINSIIKDFDAEKTPLIGLSKISFEVKNIERLSDDLKKKKVKIKYPLFKDEQFKERSFIIEDLDGNLIQFMERY